MLNFAGRKIEDLGSGCSVDVDPGTGTTSLPISILLPPGRGNLAPPFVLNHSSGGTSSPFGIGWILSGQSVIGINTSRDTPRWNGTDNYQIGGDELVPWLEKNGGTRAPRVFERGDWSVGYYRSRRRSTRLRVEKWLHRPTGRMHFRAPDKQSFLTVYGARPNAAEHHAAPGDETRTLLWFAFNVGGASSW